MREIKTDQVYADHLNRKPQRVAGITLEIETNYNTYPPTQYITAVIALEDERKHLTHLTAEELVRRIELGHLRQR